MHDLNNHSVQQLHAVVRQIFSKSSIVKESTLQRHKKIQTEINSHTVRNWLDDSSHEHTFNGHWYGGLCLVIQQIIRTHKVNHTQWQS